MAPATMLMAFVHVDLTQKGPGKRPAQIAAELRVKRTEMDDSRERVQLLHQVDRDLVLKPGVKHQVTIVGGMHRRKQQGNRFRA